jgi:hypothetical protein
MSQVAINGNNATPAPSAMLDVSSTNKGLLLPRMTSVQRKTITKPEVGLLVFDTDRQTIYLFDGVQWKPMMVTLDQNVPLTSRTPVDITPYSEFGAAVDIYGNFAIVGAPNDTAAGIQCGTAYIYAKENGSWKQHAKLYASNAAFLDRFGSSVSIYNDIAVVGAPNKTISGASAKGRVYVFKRTGHVWTQLAGLQASNGLAGDNFGASVSLDANRLIVGAPNTNHSGKTHAGSAYIFAQENNNWVQKKILNAWDPVSFGNFGFAVDLSGTAALVGAPQATAGQTATVGAAYTFGNTDFAGAVWANGQKLEPNQKQAGMRFGHAVDVDGDRILVGAPYTLTPGGQSSVGMVVEYKKENSQWSMASYLNPIDGYESVGTAVALSGPFAFYGSPDWDSPKGRVSVYSWTQGVTYRYDEDREARRFFGKAIAAHDGQFIIGAPGASDKGAVFFGLLD